jgi:hypothetical protein
LFSLKTYKEFSPARQQTENQFSSMSSEHWKDWVIEQRQEYSQRKKSAHLIRESESTSLAWPTASVAGCVEGGVAKNVEMTSGGFKATRENGTSYGAKLRDAVETYEKKNWATPNTMDHMDQRSPEALQRQFETTRKGRTAPANLREQVHPRNWPTVTVGEEKYRIKGNSQASKCLSAMAVRGELGPQDPVNPNTTGKSQESQGKLNPNWVEQLMGLPVGWTDLGFWATE